MNKFLIGVLFSFYLAFSATGKELYSTDSSQIDSGVVDVRSIDTAFYKSFKNDSDFNYEISIEPKAETVWQRFRHQLWRWVKKILGEANQFYNGFNVLFKVFFWLLVAGILFFAIRKIKFQQLFYTSKEEEKKDFVVSDLEEDIDDLEEAITNAVGKNNYRKAIRFQFIDVLRKLDQNGLIILTTEKTNVDYLRELRKSNYDQETFRSLMTIYNAVWYGHFEIGEKDYMRLSELFTEFKSRVHE